MIVGIDLGTTNSLVAVWQDGNAVIIPNSLGHHLTPSCVSLDDNGDVLVGLAARDRMLSHPSQTAALFKRYMGTQHEVRLGKRVFRPEELSSLILKSLKADAEHYLGQPVTEAIITVPAYFNDVQRKATKLAGELAGLKVERLLNEPTAAALAYGLHQGGDDSQFLVLDLGGGTFDISILEMFSGVMEVRATAGDNHLGGEDFVDALVQAFLDREATKAAIKRDKLQPHQMALLNSEAERVKRELTSSEQAMFRYVDGDTSLEWTVDNAEFEKITAPLLKRLREPVERAMRDAGLRVADLQEVVLVGGATRMPIVHRLVAKMMGRFPRRDMHPDEAIVIGAAVQAGLKMQDAALDDVVMTDVCPYTLGVEVAEKNNLGQYRHGIFLPVIERNTVIPASRSHPISPLNDEQKVVALRIFQGESREVKDNVLLGSLDVTLPSAKESNGWRDVDVRFTYDVNGLIEVEATVLATQQRYALVIEQTPGAMTTQEIAHSLEKLANLKISPREQAENKALLARLGRLYQQMLGQERQIVSDWTRVFENALETQEPRAIQQVREQLSVYADQLEGRPVL